FDSLTNNANLQWSMSGPAGAVVSNFAFNASDNALNNPVLALTAGDYILTVAAASQVTGSYSFRLSDLASASPFSLNAQVGGKLDPASSTNLHQFSAKAGDALYFESLKLPFALGSSTNTTQLRLVDPFGHILFRAFLGSDAGRVTLP